MVVTPLKQGNTNSNPAKRKVGRKISIEISITDCKLSNSIFGFFTLKARAVRRYQKRVKRGNSREITPHRKRLNREPSQNRTLKRTLKIAHLILRIGQTESNTPGAEANREVPFGATEVTQGVASEVWEPPQNLVTD